MSAPGVNIANCATYRATGVPAAWGAQNNHGRLRVEPEIEFVTRIVQKLRIVTARAQASSHKNEFLGEFRKLRIEGNREREIGHRPTFINRHLVRIFVNHAEDKVSRILVRWLGRWRSFWEWRNNGRLMPPAIIPGPRIRDLAITLLPILRLVACAHQRKSRTRNYGNIGAPDNFKQSQRVSHLLIAPLIPADHSDAKNLNLRRLDHQQQSLHVASAGARAVFVDDDLAARLGETSFSRKKQQHEEQKVVFHGIGDSSGERIEFCQTKFPGRAGAPVCPESLIVLERLEP